MNHCAFLWLVYGKRVVGRILTRFFCFGHQGIPPHSHRFSLKSACVKIYTRYNVRWLIKRPKVSVCALRGHEDWLMVHNNAYRNIRREGHPGRLSRVKRTSCSTQSRGDGYYDSPSYLRLCMYRYDDRLSNASLDHCLGDVGVKSLRTIIRADFVRAISPTCSSTLSHLCSTLVWSGLVLSM